MIDPISALAAVSSVVSMIKKASKTVDDVKSLSPLIGRYFQAKKRAASMEKDSLANDIKNKEEIRLKRIKYSENLEFSIVCSLLVVCFGCIFWGAFELIMYCQNNRCGR